MTQEDLQEIKDLLADESDKWRLEVDDWMGYVEELVDEVDRLHSEVSRWKENYHDYCDLQLDLFRKSGMAEAAKRCVEMAGNTFAHHIGKCAGDIIADEIRKEFNLPKSG